MRNDLLTHNQHKLSTPSNRGVRTQSGEHPDTPLDGLFTRLVEQTPCLVKIIASERDIGQYYSTNQYTSRSIPHIEIESTGDKAENVVSLLHEKVHAEHEKNGCKCMDLSSHTFSEYHAFRDSLKAALKFGDKKIVKLMLRDINKETNRNDQCVHRSAARRIVKLKLWQKALDFVKDKNKTPHIAPV